MPAPTSPPRRVDGSMSLLVDLMAHAEDPAYADAALSRQRAHRATAPRRRRRALTGAFALVLVGAATGTAAAAVRGDGGDGRARLVEEVTSRTAESDALAAQALALRADVAARRDASLASGDAARLRELELASATAPVVGPGVVATLDDAPDAGDAGTGLPRGGQVGTGRVLDRDLQGLVNGLWAAGAEAISVNDLRLTARTAIRSAGEAVLVDFRPVSPPYVVRAIGDPGRLEPDLVDGAAGQRLATYTSLYGLRFDLRDEDSLSLPAGTVAEPRSAVPEPS